MNRCSRSLIAAVSLIAAAGCIDGDTQAPSPQQYQGAEVEQIPHNVLSAAVLVRAAGYDSAFIEYQGGAGSPVVRTPALGFAGDTLARVPVLGLDTATAYTFRVGLTHAGSTDTLVDSLPFTSGSLPAWIPLVGTIGASAQPGYTVLSLAGGAVIVDNTGKAVWYHASPNATFNSVQAQPAGLYSIVGPGPIGAPFALVNSLGEDVGTLACNGRPTRFHEMLLGEAGDAWLLCDETRTMDLSAMGGVADAAVTATVVQHLSATGSLLWEWNSFDHFSITDLPLAGRTGPAVNFTHGNALGFDSDSNLILGFRSLSEITKVDRVTGAVIWRFGGLANQFTIVDDPKGAFQGQHGVRWAGEGRVQILDNGISAPSRMVRYLLDTPTMTATMQWEFIDAPTTYTAVGGSTQYHLDGGATGSFGLAGRVIELGASGIKTWELTGLTGSYIFRVQRIGSLYNAGRGEPTR